MKRFLVWLPLAAAVLLLGCPRKEGTCEQDVHCKAGQKCCTGLCRSVQDDIANCGSCGTICSTLNASPTCFQGSCQVGCNPGFGNCNADVRDGCEQSLAEATANCGGCGNVCRATNASSLCRQGGCVLGSCNTGFADCDGPDAGTGCETDTRANATHCGGCNKPCAPANATGRCMSNACRIDACTTGFGDCNMMATDGCETDTRSSAAHCGMCGNPCSAEQTCIGGMCASKDLLLYGGAPDTAGSSIPSSDVYKVNVDAKTFTLVQTGADGGTTPPGRFAHAAAWDGPRKRMVVWGGATSGSGALADDKLWSLEFATDPPVWKEVATTGAPPAARYGAATAHDPVAGKLYMHGGSSGMASVGDMHALDLATNAWSQVHVDGAPGAPGARTFASAAWDETGKKMVLFGGMNTTNFTTLADLWTFDPAANPPAWSQLTPSMPPASRATALLIGTSSPLHLFGGFSFPSFVSNDETWALNLSASPPAFSQLTPTGTPGPRAYAAACAAGPLRILYGGGNFSMMSMTQRNDLWAYDPAMNKWTELIIDGAAGNPTGRLLPSLVARQ